MPVYGDGLVTPKVLVGDKDYVTRFVDLAGSVINAGAKLIILKSEKCGHLEQVHIRSPNILFRLLITIDSLNILSKTYTEIRQISQNSPEISAYAELDEDGNLTGFYVASIRDIIYRTSILIEVQNTGGILTTFSQLFAKYRIKE